MNGGKVNMDMDTETSGAIDPVVVEMQFYRAATDLDEVMQDYLDEKDYYAQFDA